ncbi:MAG: TetR/AcrR family transcriptional regulator [Christensenellales bacterium]|jgi:AcrR family transcriptional regulator
MPSKTFFNLADAKRERLMNAIRQELSRVPFSKVSINQIVQAADISRGSFYQYFENKQDMLEYLLYDYRDMFNKAAEKSLKKSGGDIFMMFLDILDFTYRFASLPDNMALFKNIFSDMSVGLDFLKRQPVADVSNDLNREFTRLANATNLDIRGDEDLAEMLSILLMLTCEMLAMIFFDMQNYSAIRSRYIKRLNLLKRGFQKEYEEDA